MLLVMHVYCPNVSHVLGALLLIVLPVPVAGRHRSSKMAQILLLRVFHQPL